MMTYYYKQYEWTAFREADLLKPGDTNLNCGDTFVMPASATVCMSTWDNDGTLSGDEYCNENASDRTGQLATVDGARVGSQMYAESYHVLKGSDGKIYYLIEIEVEGYDAPGAGDDFFTFYGAKPPAGVTLTVINTCNVTGCMIDYRCLGAGDKAPPNTPPTFTNVPEDGVFCVDENTTLVIDLAATDKDGDTLTYEIVGGTDASSFEIDPATGVLTFKAAPDHEAPDDSNGDNAYQVNVRVSDGKGGSEIRCLTVNVCDVPEGGGKECVVIEAEDMRLCNYRVECRTGASDGANIVLTSSSGTASTTFAGATGIYDMTISYMDESDGKGAIDVFVNGVRVQRIYLNQNDDGKGGAGSTFSDFTIQDLNLKAGDVITLKGYGNCGEYARIDKIKICNDEPEPEPGALEGRLFCDENDNSVDDGEPGVPGVTVTLFAADGTTVIATTTTAADGSYSFTNLPAGEYVVGFPTSVGGKVLVDANQGGDDTIDSDADQGTGKTGPVTVVAGATTKDVDAGIEELPGSLSGRYFIDADGNGLDDDGAGNGVAGVMVELLDAAGVPTGITTTTDADGNYSFSNLKAGTYGVKFTDAVSGLALTTPNVGGDDAIDSDAIGLGGGLSQITGIVVTAGNDTPDNDAGVTDPKTGAIGDRVWIDANGNGEQDLGEDGKAGVSVSLIAGGLVIATTTTDANGNYLFDGLGAGDYKVLFGEVDDFVFTTQDAGGLDDSDSDADPTTGETGTITLGVGEVNLTVDAGLVAVNDPPTPEDDMGKGCVTDPVTVDALANDSDPEGDSLTITAVNGLAIAEGGSVSVDGVTVSLVGGQLVFDGSSAAALVALNLGEQATTSYSYTVSDGVNAAIASIDVTWCGSAETLEELYASLPTFGSYQVITSSIAAPFGTDAFDIRIDGTGDVRLDGVIFERAYCLSYYDAAAATEDFGTAPVNTADILAGTDTSAFSPTQKSFANGLAAADNLDLINWLIAQDFVGANAAAVDGQFTDWEIQRAIWELTDKQNTDFMSGIDPAFGNNADVDWLVAEALANGEGFTPEMSGMVTLILDPNPASATNSQPFIVAFNAPDYDCLCG